jgi:hypothetical protein
MKWARPARRVCLQSNGRGSCLDLLSRLSDKTSHRSHAWREVRKALENVGLSSETSKNTGVKAFLNRIAGVPVHEQKLVLGLFMLTLDD